MKEAVVMKSYHNGIMILLNDEVPFEFLLNELAEKFCQARAFFKEAKLALSLEGRSLTKDEELKILETIQENSDIHIICIVGKDDDTDKMFVKALRQVDKHLGKEPVGQFYKGNLKNREVLETEADIIILGDVSFGCKVISKKNIIILGGLYGEAYAGAAGGDEKHYIVALEMEPEKIKIGDFKYISHTKRSKWGTRSRIQPKIAYVKNERIVYAPLTKDLLGCFS